MTQSVGDILMEAAAKLDEHGWCVDELLNGQGQMCALGALNKVLFNDASWLGDHEASTSVLRWTNSVEPRQYDLYNECRRALLRASSIDTPAIDIASAYGIARINNNYLKDKQEAVEWFEKAAANEGYTP